MKPRPLGRTGLRVSPLCLGGLNFGSWGTADDDDCIRVIQRALDAGINFIDTADLYSRGGSEEIVRKAIAGRRDKLVLATKFSFPMTRDPNDRGTSRRWIFRAVEDSLRRLGTDWIDLYQMHRWDPEVDHEETLGALTDLVRQGKVRYLGSSTLPAAEIVEAQWVARDRRLERYVCEQPPYSLLVRGIEADVLPTCRKHGIGAIVWSPLAGGWLSGRWRRDGDDLESRRLSWLPARYDLSEPANAAKLEAADALARLADELGVTLIHLAIAFALNHPDVTSAIIGPRTIDHLESQLGATDLTLDDEVLDRIDSIVPPGTTVNPVDRGWENPSLATQALRRPTTPSLVGAGQQ
jgi:aryl-alcohol dehydrogenase-like predicted oxidoreductase